MTPQDLKPPAKPEARMTRVFDAPRALVFEAWTRPDYFARWFGPRGFTMQVFEMDVRTGGHFRMAMIGHGAEHPFDGQYLEVVPNERIVWTSGFADGPSPDQVLTTVTFEDAGEQTRIHVHQVFQTLTPETALYAAGMQQGWEETLDRFGEFLAQR